MVSDTLIAFVRPRNMPMRINPLVLMAVPSVTDVACVEGT